jgi:hypothetical protein
MRAAREIKHTERFVSSPIRCPSQILAVSRESQNSRADLLDWIGLLLISSGVYIQDRSHNGMFVRILSPRTPGDRSRHVSAVLA